MNRQYPFPLNFGSITSNQYYFILLLNCFIYAYMHLISLFNLLIFVCNDVHLVIVYFYILRSGLSIFTI